MTNDILDRDWGFINKLCVEADTFQALLGACNIAATYNKAASHFQETDTPNGGKCLALKWHQEGDALALPFELKGGKEMAEFVRSWLQKNGKWPKQTPNTDGSYRPGFRVENRKSFYDVFTLTTVYIVYGK